MRSYVIAMMLVGVLQRDAVAQQAPVAAPVPTVRSARAERREAEKRRRRIDFIPATTADGALARPWNRGNSGVLGTTLLTSADEQTNFEIVRRKVSGSPEVHARWDDLIFIRSGNGAIVTGDSLVGSVYRAPGERAGGHFNKSYEIVVHAGDVIRIPAAVPHVVVVAKAQMLEYLLIKQRRQELPIRWFAER